ncbi:hypothetical protein A0256_21325 [Mucilaginibacter sp. PAMC 26640]|nr:hypothetical protein A0256_21325 [Mucilaginibacter sp. PAMC 26640]
MISPHWLASQSEKILISTFDTLLLITLFTEPILRNMMLLSAVNIRVGRMYDDTGKLPASKSAEVK